MRDFLGAAVLGGAMVLAAPLLAAEASYDLDPFTGVDISSGIDATITIGEPQSITATSSRQEHLDELILEVENGTLVARFDWNLLGFLFEDERQIRLDIVVPALEAAAASSGAGVEATGVAGERVRLEASSGADLVVLDAAGTDFDIAVSSGADLRVDGTCETAAIGVSSGSDLQAEKLTCATVDIGVSSGSDAEIFAGERLRANASSGSDILVHGAPAEREIEASSGGDIEFAD